MGRKVRLLVGANANKPSNLYPPFLVVDRQTHHQQRGGQNRRNASSRGVSTTSPGFDAKREKMTKMVPSTEGGVKCASVMEGVSTAREEVHGNIAEDNNLGM